MIDVTDWFRTHPHWLLMVPGALAIACLYLTVRYWRLAHMIGDTARARVRSAPHGYVELYGEAQCTSPTQPGAPLTGHSCVWWHYEIQRRSGRSWCRVSSASSDAPFVLRDETGSCQVDPRGALITPSVRQVWYGSDEWPSAPYSTGLGAVGSPYRYVEQRIHEHDNVCVLGELSAVGGVAGADTDYAVSALLHEWKNQPQALLARFDQDHDGQLKGEEWEQARTAARAEVLAREARQPVTKVMTRPADGRPYVVAAKDPARLAQSYRWQAAATLLGFFLAVIALLRAR
jgi:hypothetical protein